MALVELTAVVSHDQDGALVIGLAGEFDIDSSPVVSECVASAVAAGESRIVVDLGDVTFVDSSGLRALLVAHRGATEAGASLIVRSPTKLALDLLLVTGLDRVLHIQNA